MTAPSGEWLTQQLRRAEAHADRVALLLERSMAEVLTDAGSVAAAGFTARATALATPRQTVTAAAPGMSPNATMIALKPTPEQAAALALPAGLPADTLHLTLCYLGETEGPLSVVVDALRPVALTHASLAGTVGGVGAFNGEPPEGFPLIVLPDVPGLVELRLAVTEALVEADIEYARNHGYCPHITLAYVEDAAAALPLVGVGGPINFGDLLIVRGDTEIIPLPLSGRPPVTAAASWDQPGSDPVADIIAAWQADFDRGPVSTPFRYDALPAWLREPRFAEQLAKHGVELAPPAVPPRWHEEADGLEHRVIRDSARPDLDSWAPSNVDEPLWEKLQALRAAGRTPLPGELASKPSLRERIRAVAEKHAPEGGYGETWFRSGIPDGKGGTTYSGGVTVFWTCADWTTNEEIDAAVAAFLAVDGVGHVDYDAEARPTEWYQVYGGSYLAASGPPLYQWFAAGDPPPFLAPAADEVIDVDALIARITERLKPVRDAAVRAAAEATIGGAYEVPAIKLKQSMSLYHVTPAENAAGIRKSGLLPQSKVGGPLLETGQLLSAAQDGTFLANARQAQILAAQHLELTGERPAVFEAFLGKNAVVFQDPLLPESALIAKGGVPARHVEEIDDATLAGRAALADPDIEGLFRGVQPVATVRVGIAYDVTNPLVAEVLAQSGSQIVDIAETTQLNVMRIVAASYREGLSIPNTAKAIREGMAEASPARARLIARTEMVGAVNGGSLAAVQTVSNALGVAYHKVWMTAPGAKHPRHYLYDGLNGQQRKLAGKFLVAGYELDHPGDPQGPAGEICNCRCTMRYDEGPPTSDGLA